MTKHAEPTQTQSPSHGALWTPLSTLREEVDRLFDDFGVGLWRTPRPQAVTPGGALATGALLSPALELIDCDGQYEIKAELPGLLPADIDLDVEDGLLTLRGEIAEEKRDTKGDYLMSERRYGAFQRRLRLPSAADADKITATLSQGILTITIPKTAQARETARKIAIKSS